MRSARSVQLMLGAAACGGLLLAASATLDERPLVVWNATDSAPKGLYRVHPLAAAEIQVGELVILRPDASDAALFAERGYLPADVPLLKRIAAVAGQLVCEHNRALTIDGKHVADALPTDGRGRRLNAWNGCRRVLDDEVFVLMADVPASLDGRYFGPTPLRSVTGRATPIWTWDGHR
jgi:conjugative transfer signal peptidase TraF